LRSSNSNLSEQLKSARRALKATDDDARPERAFLVGLDYKVRSRAQGKGTIPSGAQAARDGAARPSSQVPKTPQFSAEESLAELRTLATSAGAEVVGEFLQHRDRPDPATLIGSGKLTEIAGDGRLGFCRSGAF
jgi:GTP-binding protein HflX